MTHPVEQALDQFVARYLSAQQQRHHRLPRIEADSEWPSACYQGAADEQGMQAWQPVRQAQPTDMFERLAEALEAPAHPDIVAYYSRYWSDPLPARCDQGDLALLFVWNRDDFERLRGNLVGHLLDCRRRKRPDALFFACTDPEEYVLSVHNHSGAVLLEQPGSKTVETISPSLAEFIDSLQPKIGD